MNRKERNYQVSSKIKSFHCNNGECSSHLESKECGGSQPWSLSRGTQTCHYQDQNHKKHPFREEKHRQTNQNLSRERESYKYRIYQSLLSSHLNLDGWMFFKTRSRHNYLYSVSPKGAQVRGTKARSGCWLVVSE